MKRLNRFLNSQVVYNEACKDFARGHSEFLINSDAKIVLRHNPQHRLAVGVRAVAENESQVAEGLNISAVLGRFLNDGPKCVQLTRDQVEALSRTDVTLPWGNYTHPFPAFAAVLPDDHPSCGPNLPEPSAVIAYHDPAARVMAVIVIGSGRLEDLPMTSWYAIPESLDGTAPHIDHLERRPEPEYALTADEFTSLRSLTRVVMNAALLLTNYGVKDLGPANPEYAAKLAASLKKAKLPASVRSANQRALDAMPRLYSFAQAIDIGEHRHTESSDGQATGREMLPHWRRGHWAQQPCGTARQERRLIFRKPVMVRADRFAGDPSATSAVYRLPELATSVA